MDSETRIVRINGDALEANVERDISYPDHAKEEVCLPVDTVGDFKKELEKLHIGMWRRRYVNPCVDDGVFWKLEILYEDGGDVEVWSGSNAYPDSFAKFMRLLGAKGRKQRK